MPELPEVEAARRLLERALRGARIVDAIARDRLVVKGGATSFSRGLVGQVVREVSRKGKRLRITLANGTRLFAHLGMSGKWVRRDPAAPTERWERARIDAVHRGRTVGVRYVDPRRLGRMELSSTDIRAWTSLGPDPLLDGIDVDRLMRLFEKRRRSVKDAIMDQSLVAGIGNIYATEALFLARIDPRSDAGALRHADLRRLVMAIHTVLDRALASMREEGTLELTYVHEARAENPFTVYGRAGEPCPRCTRPLLRVVLSGRGTTLCSSCQRRVSR